MLSIKYLLQYLLVIEVVLHSFDFLIIFMSFSGNKNYISLFCQHTSSTNRFLTVGNADCLLISSLSSPASISLMMSCGSSKRGLSDVIITRSLAFAASFAMIGRFPLIAVATGTYHSDYFSFAFEYSMYRVQYVHQRIRSMCIVNDCRHSFR